MFWGIETVKHNIMALYWGCIAPLLTGQYNIRGGMGIGIGIGIGIDQVLTVVLVGVNTSIPNTIRDCGGRSRKSGV